MASKVVSPTQMIRKSDFMKSSTNNFLENERVYNHVQRGGVYRISEESGFSLTDIPHKHVLSNRAHVENQPLLSRSGNLTSSVTETREEAGIYAPRRFTTTCYFKPKQNPVSYSETVILVLGSNKKHYFDTILYQTKMVPFRWTETLTTVIKQDEQLKRSEYQADIIEPKYHYMSLEPQQIAASQHLQSGVAA